MSAHSQSVSLSDSDVTRKSELLALLRREQFELDAGYDAAELAYRRGWNGRADELIAWLSQGCVDTGLRELSANAPTFDLSDGDSGDA